ncbi:MAG: hypothetical protein K6G16_03035 [Lachnospiraceae bacterium]|nr:hypothetical protein [Lachnospiraceae bacterium]
MKNTTIRHFVTGIAAVSLIAALTACGKTAPEAVTQAADAVQEAADAVADEEDGLMSLEDQIKAVQDTLTYMGGLKTADGADKKIELAIFRNDNGDVIYIYAEGDSLDYGIYTTETTKTADGREYARITGGTSTYGYYFNDDLVSGILVDTAGNVYDAVELDEDACRAYVAKTLGG